MLSKSSETDRKPVGSDDDATKIKHPVNCVILWRDNIIVKGIKQIQNKNKILMIFLINSFILILLQFLLRCANRFLFRFDLSYRGFKVLECYWNHHIPIYMYIYVDIHLRKEVNINYKLFHLFTHNTQSKPQTHALTVTKVLLLFVRYLVFF